MIDTTNPARLLDDDLRPWRTDPHREGSYIECRCGEKTPGYGTSRVDGVTKLCLACYRSEQKR